MHMVCAQLPITEIAPLFVQHNQGQLILPMLVEYLNGLSSSAVVPPLNDDAVNDDDTITRTDDGVVSLPRGVRHLCQTACELYEHQLHTATGYEYGVVEHKFR
jgi:hypothetical protein